MKNLNQRDIEIFNAYNSILKICENEFYNTSTIANLIGLSTGKIGHYLSDLKKYGFMEFKEIRVGVFSRVSKHYKSLVNEYPIESYVTVQQKRLNNFAASGNRAGVKRKINQSESNCLKTPSNVRVYAFDNKSVESLALAEKINQQCKNTREEKKKTCAKVYISGESLGMF